MVGMLTTYAKFTTSASISKSAALVALSPVLAAQSTKVASLIDMLHAFGCETLTDEAIQSLFYRLLTEEETMEQRLLFLKSCRFSLPPLEPPDECANALPSKSQPQPTPNPSPSPDPSPNPNSDPDPDSRPSPNRTPTPAQALAPAPASAQTLAPDPDADLNPNRTLTEPQP